MANGIPKPESGWKRFSRSDTPWDLFTVFAGLGSGGSGAYRLFTIDSAVDPNAVVWGWFVGVGVVLAALSQIGKVIKRHRQEWRSKNLHDLMGCLHTMNAVLLGEDSPGQAKLRSTLHLPQANNTFVQAFDYVGDSRKKRTVGRIMSVNTGAVGKAYRERAIMTGSREDGSTTEAFVRQMMETYGYTEEQARELDSSTQSWIAVPIPSGGPPIEAMLYCDSVEREFFEDELRQQHVAYAASGIAFYVGARYH